MTLSAKTRACNLSALPRTGQNETRLVQQLYRPEAILLGSRKMKTLPRYRLQKELD